VRLLFISLVGLGGCADMIIQANWREPAGLIARASADLGCDSQRIRVERYDSRWLASGCNRQAAYVHRLRCWSDQPSCFVLDQALTPGVIDSTR
jgi:hypothetical protein